MKRDASTIITETGSKKTNIIRIDTDKQEKKSKTKDVFYFINMKLIKKNDMTLLEELDFIQKKQDLLTEKAKQIKKKCFEKVGEELDSILSSDNTKVILELKNIALDECECSLCSIDFSLCILKDLTSLYGNNIYDNPYKNYIQKCLGCGYIICYKCVIRILSINQFNRNSIGYSCPGCRLFNSNLIKKSKYTLINGESNLPFSSGITTVKNKKGYLLLTNDTDESNTLTHEINMDTQRLFLDQSDDDDENGDEDNPIILERHI